MPDAVAATALLRRATATIMESLAPSASVVAHPKVLASRCRESTCADIGFDALGFAAASGVTGRHPPHSPVVAAVPSPMNPPSTSSWSFSDAQPSLLPAAGTSSAAASSAGPRTTAARQLSIADYSVKALPLLLPLTAQTSSPSRVKFRKELLRRMGLLLGADVSHQQQKHQLPEQQQQNQLSRQADVGRQQQQGEAGVSIHPTRTDSAVAVGDITRSAVHGRENDKQNCWVYIHPVETAKELRQLCGQLVDAFRVCYMTDQDLYFADAVLQQQEQTRRSRRNLPRCNGESVEGGRAPNGKSGSNGSTADRLHLTRASAAAAGTAFAEENNSEAAGEIAVSCDDVASGLAVYAGAPAGARDVGCSCCCCYCCRCRSSSEDEEELIEEWGQLAHCESPSNLRRALFEIQLRLQAAIGCSAAAPFAASPTSRGGVAAADGDPDVKAATVFFDAALVSPAAISEPASSPDPAPVLRSSLRQLPVDSAPRNHSRKGGDESVAREAAATVEAVDEEERCISTKKKLLLQHECKSPRTAEKCSLKEEEAKMSVFQNRKALVPFVVAYIMHLQHLINRFCAPANGEHDKFSSHKNANISAAGQTDIEGDLSAAADQVQATRSLKAEKEQQQYEEGEGELHKLQQQECALQQEEEHQERSDESVEEEELSRRCHAEAKKLGVCIHPDIQLKKSSKATGRGLFAARRIASGSVLFEIPQNAMINVYTALQDPVFAPVAEWLLTLRPEEEEMQQGRSDCGVKEEELISGREGVYQQLSAEQFAGNAGEQLIAVETETEGNAVAAGAAVSACDDASRHADPASVSLSDLKGEGRPLVDADTLCLLYFLFEAYRATRTVSSSRNRDTQKHSNSYAGLQTHYEKQVSGGYQHQHEHQLEAPERQEDEKEEKGKGSRFSFFFELLPARHEEHQQPLIAGPPEVPELLQDVPLSRAIDSTLLRSFELYRRLLPLLKDAFATNQQAEPPHPAHRTQDQGHQLDEVLQQQERETSLGGVGECMHEQHHQEKDTENQTWKKPVHSTDRNPQYKADFEEATASKRAAATIVAPAPATPMTTAPTTPMTAARATPVTAAPATPVAEASLVEFRTVEESSSELREWIKSLTLEQFIWGQCHMGSRAFALQVPPPRDDPRWRRVAVQQHDTEAEEGEEEAAGEATAQETTDAFAAKAPAQQVTALAVNRTSQSGDRTAGRERQKESDACPVEEDAAEPQHAQVDEEEEEDVVAFLPMLRDRPPRGRSLYCRCTDPATMPSSSSSSVSSSWPAANPPVSPSSTSVTKEGVPSSFAIPGSRCATAAHTATEAAAAGSDGSRVDASVAGDDNGRRARRNLKGKEGAPTGDCGEPEIEKEGSRTEDGRTEKGLERPMLAATIPAGTIRGGVLHVPDHPTTFLPFVDLANHHVHAQCCFPFYDATTGTAKVVAHADIPAAAEIFLFYGPLQSWELLAQFGFTTNTFFALEKRKEEKRHQQSERLRQQRILQQQQEQGQQTSQQPPAIDTEQSAAARRLEEEQPEEKKYPVEATSRSYEENVFLTGLPAKKQRWDCCGAWNFTKEKQGNPYDTLTLCFEPADEEDDAEEGKNSSRKRQLLSRLFDISGESLLRTGAPHFSPRLLESLQVSLHPDVDELLHLLLRKKKKQEQYLCERRGRVGDSILNSPCCEGNVNNVGHSENMKQEHAPAAKKEKSDLDAGGEDDDDDNEEKKQLQTLYKTPVVQTVEELMRPCVEGRFIPPSV